MLAEIVNGTDVAPVHPPRHLGAIFPEHRRFPVESGPPFMEPAVPIYKNRWTSSI
jgi:hypothetical protein